MQWVSLYKEFDALLQATRSTSMYIWWKRTKDSVVNYTSCNTSCFFFLTCAWEQSQGITLLLKKKWQWQWLYVPSRRMVSSWYTVYPNVWGCVCVVVIFVLLLLVCVFFKSLWICRSISLLFINYWPIEISTNQYNLTVHVVSETISSSFSNELTRTSKCSIPWPSLEKIISFPEKITKHVVTAVALEPAEKDCTHLSEVQSVVICHKIHVDMDLTLSVNTLKAY